MEAIDDTPSQRLSIGGAVWNGWRLGRDDVYILEARAHTDHDVLVYIPAERMLCMGDVTFPLFPTWADSNSDRIIECLRKCLAMVEAGEVAFLADGHGDRCYQGRAQIQQLLETVLADHMAFETVLKEIFEAADGLTPAEIYRAFLRFRDRPVVGKYLALEFPHTPVSLQNAMVTTLLQLGYQARGERRRMRFFRAQRAAA
jgi:glyoxylase-like metal-dependent hydrolase (beta-lactamase superfamily II)